MGTRTLHIEVSLDDEDVFEDEDANLPGRYAVSVDDQLAPPAAAWLALETFHQKNGIESIDDFTITVIDPATGLEIAQLDDSGGAIYDTPLCRAHSNYLGCIGHVPSDDDSPEAIAELAAIENIVKACGNDPRNGCSQFPRSVWTSHFENGDTHLQYWEWVHAQNLEARIHPELLQSYSPNAPMHAAVDTVSAQCGGTYGNCAQFSRKDWEHEMLNIETRLDYWEWVIHQAESNGIDLKRLTDKTQSRVRPRT